MNDSDFWSNKDESDRVIKEVSNLKNIIEPIKKVCSDIKSNLDTLQEIDDEESEFLCLITEELLTLSKTVDNLELQTYLSGEYDHNNCLIEIHPGAGGTESCDWASMLYRMYQRYFKNKGYSLKEIDILEEDVGIKSVLFLVKGENAYGYLKGENGVHRLVRISPFDAGKRRHTSFASVEVIPEINDNVDIVINDSDIRIDIYRSSGAGGQGVNTTDSAVRITHLPTKIVVTCQNERSQLRNKEIALNILKSKLKLLEIEKQQEKLNDITKDKMTIGFGSAKRSYIMCPYTLVKDNDTNYQTSDVYKVLEGDLEDFIIAGIRRNHENI